MNDNQNNNLPNGFDFVSSKENENQVTPDPTFAKPEENNTGYVVSPDGNFYTNSVPDAKDGVNEPKADTENLKTDEENTAENKSDDVSAKDFLPNGTYSYSAAKGNLPDSALNVPENPTVSANDFSQNQSSDFSSSVNNNYVFNNENKPKKHKPKKCKPNKPKKYGTGVVFASVILSAVLGIGGGFGGAFLLTHYQKSNSQNAVSSSVSQNITNITVDETVNSTTEAVAKKSGPAVIGIRTTAAVTNFFFGTSEETEEGSGIIYTSDGYIITNYHVIESAVESSNSKVEVFLPENSEKSYEAAVVGYNISSDLAVVKIEAANLKPIQFADSEKLTVGQNVIAIGNPGGLEFMGSVSTGVISGLNRSITVGTGATMNLIQTDAAINPGNSGGALVNTQGELIGVNSVKLVSTGFEGMGFAIPSNTVKTICDNIISKQNTPTPYIGLQISSTYTASQLKALGYPAGAVVLSVDTDGPADEAGVERGDIITEFNGKTIENYTNLDDAISDTKPGDSVTVKIYRAGRFYSTNINVEANNAG